MSDMPEMDAFVLMRALRYLVAKHSEALKQINPNMLGAYAPEVIYDNAIDYAHREVKDQWKKDDLLEQLAISNRLLEAERKTTAHLNEQLSARRKEIDKLADARAFMEKMKQ